MLRRSSLLFPLAGFVLAVGLTACDADEQLTGAPGGRTVTAKPEASIPPPVTARSQSASLKGSVAAPYAAAQSNTHRLVATGLRPQLRN